MSRGAKKCPSISELSAMAEQYGLQDNALFRAQLYLYNSQLTVIRQLEKEIEEAGTATVKKTYIKGNDNEYLHPAIKELPRQIDSASKTASTLLDILNKLGGKVTSEIMDFLASK